jgi:ketosteroid isomerase-like protein
MGIASHGPGVNFAHCIRELIMKKRPLPCVAGLAVTSLLIGAPSLPAGAAVDPLAAEAAVRKADADWAAAAGSQSADAWMSFYASDAIVLLPDDQLASGRELIRQTVTHFLERPHLSVASRPIDVQVARSGDLASLVGAYELRFESRGALVSNRGS